MESWLQKIAPSIFAYSENSTVARLRRKRFFQLKGYLDSVCVDEGQKIRILDVGGSLFFWKQCGFENLDRYHITLLNLEKAEIPPELDGFSSILGDACNLPPDTKEYDVVFSNSVIEHMSCALQLKMATEIQTKARRYIVQTPNFWFPFDPHSQIAGFQFLPHFVRGWIIYRAGNVNWFRAQDSYSGCLDVSRSIVMLSKSKFGKLFPDAEILVERLWGVPKSYIAVKGFDCSIRDEKVSQKPCRLKPVC